MISLIQLHIVVFAGLHWISLIYYWGDISYQSIFLCVVNHSLQIYLSYSMNCWIFYPLCLEGFPRVYMSLSWLIDLYGWFMELIYMTDLWRWFMWMIYLWDLHVANIFMWHMYLWDSHVADLWDTYVLKLINKCFKVQDSLILLKHQNGIKE